MRDGTPGGPAFAIAPVGTDPARVAGALAVLRSGLGQGFISDAAFLRYAAPRRSLPYRAALAAVDAGSGVVAGALTLEVVGARALRSSFLGSYDQAREAPEVARLRPGETGLIKSIAVAPESRGRGVATALVAAGLAALEARGVARVYSLAWKSARDGCLLCGVLTAAGFQTVTRLERFWYADSLAAGYVCPACGHPCVCAAQVMVR